MFTNEGFCSFRAVRCGKMATELMVLGECLLAPSCAALFLVSVKKDNAQLEIIADLEWFFASVDVVVPP